MPNLPIERRLVPWGGARLDDVTSGDRMDSWRAVDPLARDLVEPGTDASAPG